jgi:hypothetical protein
MQMFVLGDTIGRKIVQLHIFPCILSEFYEQTGALRHIDLLVSLSRLILYERIPETIETILRAGGTRDMSILNRVFVLRNRVLTPDSLAILEGHHGNLQEPGSAANVSVRNLVRVRCAAKVFQMRWFFLEASNS